MGRRQRRGREPWPAETRARPTRLPPASDPSAVRSILSQGLGVLRNGHDIERAIRGLYPIASGTAARLPIRHWLD